MLHPNEVRDILASLGMPSAPVDLASAWAAVSAVESQGDPSAVGDASLGGSYGLWQVFSGAFPLTARKVQDAISAARSEVDSATHQATILAPLMKEATTAALKTAARLQARGFAVTDETVVSLLDAVWQHGAGTVAAWAEKTTTGFIGEISNRTARMLSIYRTIAMLPVYAFDASAILLGGFALFALWRWLRD